VLSIPREATFGEGFLRGLSETLLNSITQAPAAPGRLTAAAVEGIGALVGQDFSDIANKFKLQVDLPTATDIFAAEQTIAEVPGAVLRGESVDLTDRFGRAQVEQELQSELIRGQSPVGTFVGETAGDALTVATGRAPFAVAMGRRPPVTKATPTAQPRITIPQIGKNVVNSAPVRRLMRGLGRGAETTFEAALLTALKSEDPVDIAAVSAGAGIGQLGGSLALQVLPKSKKGFAGLAVAAAGLIAALRLGQEFGPGQNNVFTAIDQSFEKLAISLAAGVVAFGAGAGRLRPRNADATVSILTDGLSTLPRGAVISIWDEVLREQRVGRSTVEDGLATLAADPGSLTGKQQREVQRALTDPNVSLSETFEKLGIGQAE
jgi:hypothetical protein